MRKSNVSIILLCLLVFGINQASSLTLSEALAYSVAGKNCSDIEILQSDKQSIQYLIDNLQSTEKVQEEIDILKEVRRLIVLAKQSIIKVDQGVQQVAIFLQNVNPSKVHGYSINEVYSMIETYEQTSDPVDKLALCDKIVAAIDELIGLQETLISKEGYSEYKNTLSNTITSIDNFVKQCKEPVPPQDNGNGNGNGNGDGSVRVYDTNNNSTIGSVKIEDSNGSVKVDDGSGSAKIDNGSGSAQIDNGSGSAQIVDNSGQSGSAKIVDTSVFVQKQSTASVSKKSQTSRKEKKSQKHMRQHKMGL